MPSLAEEHFKAIMAGLPTPADYLKTLVGTTPPTYEEDWREFKGMPQGDDLREVWSKCLSAFANTEGGVLVWGIDARQDPATKVDAAHALNLISDIAKFKSRLMQLLAESTDPPLSGVRVEVIPEASGSSKGFVVCLVPESREKPVRAEMVRNKPYYIRSGASSRIINRALLRSLFFPQAKARLVIQVHTWRDPLDARHFDFSLRNEGPSTANDLMIRVEQRSDVLFSPCLLRRFDGQMVNQTSHGQYIEMRAIHPGQHFSILQSQLPNNPNIFSVIFVVYAKDRDVSAHRLQMNWNDFRIARQESTLESIAVSDDLQYL